MQVFTLATTGRTGSSAVVEEINRYPGVVCHSEIMRPLDEATAHNNPLLLHATKSTLGEMATRAQVSQWLDVLRDHAHSAQAVGFKALNVHLKRVEGGIGTLVAEGCSIIWLTRRNTLRQAVSGALAQKIGVYNSETPPEKGRRVSLSPEEIVRTIIVKQNANLKAVRRLKRMNANYIEVYFEDFVTNRTQFHHGIQRFLGIPSFVPEPSSLAVMTPESLPDLLENYDKVAEAVIEAGYGSFLSDLH